MATPRPKSAAGAFIDRRADPFHAVVTEVSSPEFIDFVRLQEFEPRRNLGEIYSLDTQGWVRWNDEPPRKNGA
jgi:hypothetical protein